MAISYRLSIKFPSKAPTSLRTLARKAAITFSLTAVDYKKIHQYLTRFSFREDSETYMRQSCNGGLGHRW